MKSRETSVELMGRVSLETHQDLDSDEDELFNDESVHNNNNDVKDGNEEEEEEAFVLPPAFRGKQQLRAMLKRQWLFKVTTINTAFILSYIIYCTETITQGSQYFSMNGELIAFDMT